MTSVHVPGMVAQRSLILEPLAALGVQSEAVTHVPLSHHPSDQAAFDRGTERVLAAADIVIPGHGGPFRARD